MLMENKGTRREISEFRHHDLNQLDWFFVHSYDE